MGRFKDTWSAHIRKPDNDRVELHWNSDFKPTISSYIREECEEPYVHVWKNGIADHLFDWDGIEDEIERVNKKLGLE
jgi:hypothetical protein